VEVMIAIAIALLLIVGISQLFAIAQRTTSTGTSLLEVNLKQRSMQTVFNGDFHALVSDSAESPGFVIASYAAKAFRNQSDFDTATDQNDPGNFGPTYASVPGLSQAYTTSSRIHRLDRMGIFGRDVYHPPDRRRPRALILHHQQRSLHLVRPPRPPKQPRNLQLGSASTRVAPPLPRPPGLTPARQTAHRARTITIFLLPPGSSAGSSPSWRKVLRPRNNIPLSTL